MGSSLIGFDTEHVKRYVFGTNKLKEIRGASSLLDYLNRVKMEQIAKEEYQAKTIYANGGSGMFLVETDRVNEFGQRVQQEYRRKSGGGANVIFVSQPLPDDVSEIGDVNIKDTFELLQWHMQEKKLHPPAIWTLATHPFLRLCDACGIEYADASDADHESLHDRDERDARFCASCLQKRIRDKDVRSLVSSFVAGNKDPNREPLWDRVIDLLSKMGYDLSKRPARPTDFDIFRNFKGAKEYLGLIYADANNMGRHLERRAVSLRSRREMATQIDDALYQAVCTAIVKHLKVADHIKPEGEQPRELAGAVFPFDILLLGGDDICMVVPASMAMDVALTIAETFRDEMEKKIQRDETEDRYTLSASVVLAPVKYPFGLLYDMAESSLKFAKRVGADARAQYGAATDDTRINFLLVTGGSSNDFKTVYNATYYAEDDNSGQDFYTTLRPYAPQDLHLLLNAIRGQDGANLGRTKLHQMREAIFQMNLTTSVSESLAVLRNWRAKQRDHVTRSVYAFAGQYQMPASNPADPVAGFPPVIFPWFAHGKDKDTGHQIYRTPLLDFIELYDFLSRGGTNEKD